MSKRKPPDRSLLHPDDVLAGRVKPTASELLDLIHRANPTGRDISARDAEQRYALKARLQSLLVRRFGDQIDVVPDPERDGTVSLLHRGHGRDGCHAVIATLEEDARAWVQRQVDIGAHEAEAPKAPAARAKERARAPAAAREADMDDDTLEALLARAAEAIEAYDYEAGTNALSRALDVSGGDVEPAARLLALLVDTLGDDTGALAIEPSLSRAALGDAGVRGLLALAAARCGEEERALTLLRGVDDTQAAVVLAALAGRALASGDVDRAAAHVEHAKRRDPTCLASAGVASEIAKAQAEARAPMEAELAALVAAGRDELAEQKAAELLARFPDSEAARRARRTLEERAREREGERLVDEAERALLAGETRVARALFARAVLAARGPLQAALERRVKELDAREQATEQAAQVERVARMIARPEPHAGLLAYLGLDEALRARVAASSPHEALAVIDLLAAARVRDQAKVDAALALVRARAIAEGDPEAAIALLAPHEAALERAPEARRIVRDAEAKLHARRVEIARAEVQAARRALDAGDADAAAARLDAASLGELPAHEKAEATALAAEAARAIERRRREEDVPRLRAAGRLFEARARAERLAAEADDSAARARWEGERDAIRAEIRGAFRVQVDDVPQPDKELARFRQLAALDRVSSRLTTDGRRVVMADAYERWVVVRVLDRQTMLVRPTILLRTPEPFGHTDVTVVGRTVWVVGERGAILEIEMESWELLDFRSSADVLVPGTSLEKAVIVVTEDPASPRYLWTQHSTRNVVQNDRVRVFDLAQRRVVRELDDGWRPTPLAGLDEALVALRRGEACTVHEPRGAFSAHGGRIEKVLDVQEIAAHPNGRGFVALLSKREVLGFMPDPAEERLLYLAALSRSGAVESMVKLPDSDPDRPACVAATRGSGLLHTIYGTAHGPLLFTLACGDDHGLTSLYAEEIGDHTVLVQDARARHVVALAVHDEGAFAIELGATKPRLPVPPERPRVRLPSGSDAHDCDRPSGARGAAAIALAASWRRLSDIELFGRTRALQDAELATPDRLLDAVFALRFDYSFVRNDEANRLARVLAERFPNDPEVRLLRANQLAIEGAWAEARELLAHLEPGDFDDARAQHIHHLRALAALGERRFAEAREALSAGLTVDGRCDLTTIEALLGALEDAKPSPLQELLVAVQRADACIEALDHEGAVRALDTPVVWSSFEVQSLARLAEAYLSIEATSPARRLRKLAALGRLVEHVDGTFPRDRLDLPIPTAWAPPRIADVAARARAWLDT